MQRPTTTGRRHNRAGSIPVAELIRRQPTPVRIPSREQAASERLVTELMGEDAERHPRPANRPAKIAGLLTGALVVLSSVATAAILADQRQHGAKRHPVQAPIEISGSSALRPDLLSAQLGGGRAESAEPTAQAEEDERAQPPANPPVTPRPADEVPPSGSVVLPEVARGPSPRVDVVRRFFELLPGQPQAAAQLLSADLVGGDRGEFVSAWRGITAIRIESTSLRPDGTVLAVVSMQERTGRWMRVEQLFRLTDTTTPRIVGTEVLAAQRS